MGLSQEWSWITPDKLEGFPMIGQGMECRAFDIGNGMVAKLYRDINPVDKYRSKELEQQFFDSLDRHAVSFCLPQILYSGIHQGHLICVERRLPGSSFLAAMREWNDERAEQQTKLYVEALLQLHRASDGSCQKNLPQVQGTFLSGWKNDWFACLRSELESAFEKYRIYLTAGVADLDSKQKRIMDFFAGEYQGEYRMLHGDFCPENVLRDTSGNMSAVIDFGLIGCYGDIRYDLATGWAFYDMYHQFAPPYRKLFLDMLARKWPVEQNFGFLCAYILFYSFCSIGFYSSNCSDGHSRWCLDNLNNRMLWEGLEASGIGR